MQRHAPASLERLRALAQRLKATDPNELGAAVGELSTLAAEAYDEDAATLADEVRQADGISVLVGCLNSEKMEDDVQQCAISLLGNLLTDAFDPKATKSLALFLATNGVDAVYSKIDSPYPTGLYAAAALQNVTALDLGMSCARLRALGAVSKLSEVRARPGPSRPAARAAAPESERARARPIATAHRTSPRPSARRPRASGGSGETCCRRGRSAQTGT